MSENTELIPLRPFGDCRLQPNARDRSMWEKRDGDGMMGLLIRHPKHHHNMDHLEIQLCPTDGNVYTVYTVYTSLHTQPQGQDRAAAVV